MTLKEMAPKTRSNGWKIPIFCLCLAVVLLYAKPFLAGRIFHPDPMPVISDTRSDSDITMLYHERPPYYVTGPLGIYGLCVDPVKKALLAANVRADWVKMPAARQLDMVRFKVKNTCAIGWFKNPDREKYAVYSSAIYRDKPMIALARADNFRLVSGRLLAQTLGNQEVILLRKNGYSYGRFIDEMILTLDPRQKMTAAENIGMLKLVHDGLADYFFISQEEALELVQSSGLLSDNFKLIRFSDMPGGNQRYLLFSKATDKAIIDRVDAAIIEQRTADPADPATDE
ncbi:MAG: hypothetical protein K9K63_05505 [Desulfotignum sp.]|nr:hypothetical protein [Desulfotignum sp.]MCF8086800.1 hypothetical protein [Desulfotignum sp.]MCF8136749.1 hypothetical protein [Desulfotignum sp.]